MEPPEQTVGQKIAQLLGVDTRVFTVNTDEDWQSYRTVGECNRCLLENEIGTDVTFSFPNAQHKDKIKGHKLILMSRSRVFYVMFTSGLQNPDEDIQIQDMEPHVFRQFIQYLYMGEIKIAEGNALHMLYCAEKYDVKALKLKCINFLQSSVEQSTVWTILDQAVFYNESRLARRCLDHLISSRSLEGINRQHLSKETMKLIVGCETLCLPEVLIFKVCYAWVNVECEKRGLEANRENRRQILGPILSLMRFCVMTQEEFAAEVRAPELLTAEEELNIFRFLCAPKPSRAPFPCHERKPRRVPVPQAIMTQSIRHLSVPGSTCGRDLHMHVHCSMDFTLLGLVFVHPGVYKLRFNMEKCQTIKVSTPNETIYLPRPVQSTAERTILIRDPCIVDGSPRPGPTVSFNYKSPTTYSKTLINMAFTLHLNTIHPPAFNTFLVSF